MKTYKSQVQEKINQLKSELKAAEAKDNLVKQLKSFDLPKFIQPKKFCDWDYWVHDTALIADFSCDFECDNVEQLIGWLASQEDLKPMYKIKDGCFTSFGTDKRRLAILNKSPDATVEKIAPFIAEMEKTTTYPTKTQITFVKPVNDINLEFNVYINDNRFRLEPVWSGSGRYDRVVSTNCYYPDTMFSNKTQYSATDSSAGNAVLYTKLED